MIKFPIMIGLLCFCVLWIGCGKDSPVDPENNDPPAPR